MAISFENYPKERYILICCAQGDIAQTAMHWFEREKPQAELVLFYSIPGDIIDVTMLDYDKFIEHIEIGLKKRANKIVMIAHGPHCVRRAEVFGHEQLTAGELLRQIEVTVSILRDRLYQYTFEIEPYLIYGPEGTEPEQVAQLAARNRFL